MTDYVKLLEDLGFYEDEPLRFDTGGGDFGGFGDGSGQGGGYSGGDGSMGFGIEGGSYGGDAEAAAIAAGLDTGSSGMANAAAQANTVGSVLAMANELATSPAQAQNIASNALTQMGLGHVTGVNPNNPTQSAQEMQAAQNVGAALPAVMGAVIPGFGALTSAAQTIGGLISGQTTIGQAVTNLGVGVVANQLGISPGTLTAALNGNVGQAVANTAMGMAGPAIGQALGMPAGLAGLALGVTGLGQAANQGIASSINDALGITPGTGTTSAIASGINDALGVGQGGTGATGATGTAGGATPGFDFTGGAMPNFGGADTVSPAPAPEPAPASAPEAASKTPNVATLAALAALMGQEEDKPPAYQVAPWELSQRTPFGKLPYSA